MSFMNINFIHNIVTSKERYIERKIDKLFIPIFKSNFPSLIVRCFSKENVFYEKNRINL